MREHRAGTEPTEMSDSERWRAVVERDASADGRFVYGVATTGIFCHPSCGSRQPLRNNVRFFENVQAAREAGFRPCRKCFAGHSIDTTIAEVCRVLAGAEERVVWSEVAARLGVSESYLHRRFRERVGMTPGAYARAQRAERFRSRLASGETVAGALYDAGYGSSGRAYERAGVDLGMTPLQYRKGGRDLQIRFATAPCSLGWVLAARTDRGICAVELGETEENVRQRLQERFPHAEIVEEGTAMLDDVVQQIEHPGTSFHLPLDVRGTAFQQRVWEALRAIPAGTTVTYTRIAEQIGSPDAVRAVASACAANPVAVIVPCHRVLRRNGELGGYRWGLERKEKLLQREREEAAPSGCAPVRS